MTFKQTLGGLAGATALAAVMAIGAATPASADCRRIVAGQRAIGLLQTATEISARAKWRTAVRARYGYRYARWAQAKDKNMDCNKEKPGRRWICRATARACT